MTVPSENYRSGPYTGNGVTTSFKYDFRIVDENHVRVVRALVDGTEADLIIGLDYTVTGVGDQEGGDIILTSPLPVDFKLTNLRNVPFVQETDLENQGAYYAETVEKSLDLSVMRDQQLAERLARVVSLPATSPDYDPDQLINDILAVQFNREVTETARDVAVAAAGSNLVNFPSRTAAIATVIPVTIKYLLTAGYSEPGDAGGGIYFRVAAEPTHAGKFRSSDRFTPDGAVSADSGGWWALSISGPVNVKQFGAKGDYSANDAVAIQGALSCGARKIIFPKGRYYCGSTSLTVPNWLHVVGEGYQPGIVPSDAAVQVVFNLSTGVGLACGNNPVFENIYFSNAAGVFDEGTAVLDGTVAGCFSFPDNITLNWCSFALWYKCVPTGASPYYIKTQGVEFNRCTFGYKVEGNAPYNVQIDSPNSRLTYSFFEGADGQPARNIKVMGGSIEGFARAFISFLDVSLFGTYFETIAQRSGAVAIRPNVNLAAVTVVGCMVYMDYMYRFVDEAGRSNTMLAALGNVYDGSGLTNGVIYALPDPGSGDVSTSGDRFGVGLPNSLLYVDDTNKALAFNGVTFPRLPATHEQVSYSGKKLIPPGGLIMSALSAQPSNRITGMMVLANGVSWDPLTFTHNRPYWVIWQGDRWSPVSGM